MAKVTLTIDGKKVVAQEGTCILDAAESVGINIPSLCYLKGINQPGSCRICVVEVQGAKTLMASCTTPVAEGMVVKTNTPAVRDSRKMTLEMILSEHPFDCPTCPRNLNCELQALAEQMGIREIRFEGEKREKRIDTSTPAIVRDNEKCILCRRCISVCHYIQTVDAIGLIGRGSDTQVAPAWDSDLADSVCVQCGQCVMVCPVGALYEKDHSDEVQAAIDDPNKHVIVQTAPAVRVSIGEPFGLPPGEVSTGKLVAALRELGFNAVFDTNFAADLTIMEEGSEFLARLKEGENLPLITSCSPGWIKFMEHFYPDLMDNVSTCKSPQQMFGALAKSYYAEKIGVKPEDLVVVSIMPCTAKKFEANRPEMTSSGVQDVDYALTVRELARMIKKNGIDFRNLADQEFDDPFGIASGAGAIFGATGGVMEAALRTAYEIATGTTLENIDFTMVRGMDGVKEATIKVGDADINVAVAHGLKNARYLLDRVRNKEANYHFIEIMTCPGGCIGGGGQPIPTDDDIRKQRIAGIYGLDKSMTLRKSHENPAIKELYAEFLGEPLGEKSHRLLHTKYAKRPLYAEEKIV